MTVKLHVCSVTWLHGDFHPCSVARRAFDEAGVDYELVKEPLLPRSRRKDVIAQTGQKLLPAVEFEDGRWLREETAELAARVRAGRLFEVRAGEDEPVTPAADPNALPHVHDHDHDHDHTH